MVLMNDLLMLSLLLVQIVPSLTFYKKSENEQTVINYSSANKIVLQAELLVHDKTYFS